MSFDTRHRYIISQLVEGLCVSKASVVEEFLADDKQLSVVNDFFRPDGIPKLLFFNTSFQEVPNDDDDENVELVLSNGEVEGFKGKCVYFIRVGKKGVQTTTVDTDILCGEVFGTALESMDRNLTEIFVPILTEFPNWGQNSEDNTQDFLAHVGKFCETVGDAVNSLSGGVDLRKADKRYEVENKQAAIIRATQDPELIAHYDSVVEDWCKQVEKLLFDTDATRKEADDVGPNSELEFWRSRMGKLNSITEQLKSKEVKTILTVLLTAKSKVMKRWKTIDNSITDAANEAKDNVKYLSTLEKYTDPLYTGTPTTILDTLPGLMNNIKMVHTIARYYNTTERMTNLFVKITNQMINNCKASVNRGERLWDQDPEVLLKNLEACIQLNDSYQEQYRLTKDKLLTQPKGKQFDFSESQIFGKFELFCTRIQKLIDMFTTVHQFKAVADHKVEGMEALISNFFSIVDEMKKKPYDLLDYQKNQFDRDYLEFNVHIHELETALQGFINSSFENISSTELALNLLKQFQSILQRENLRADLDSKFMVIFHNYGLDLETVQKLYEKQKHNPPMVRNLPPVAGNITWSRQLLRRIEDPMKRFQTNKHLMTTKESRKIIRTYNRVARALIEFETLWHYAWCKSIDAAKSGLQATLIIRHPTNNVIYVNFDKEILQLIRETKCLQRMTIDVPEQARMVLLQEEKFKHYYNHLTYALREYDRVIGRILPVVKPLLKPHIDDLERKISPGMITLTWTSMNIDGYLHRIHTGLMKLEELTSKISDIVTNRIDSNLKIVSNCLLVDLPSDISFTLDQFVQAQEKHIKEVSLMLDAKNWEVENSVNDLVDLILSYPLENDEVAQEDIDNVRAHYLKLMYNAVLNATRKSLFGIKKRIGSRSASGFLFVERPFFDVDVELTIPEVTMNPSLDEIQYATNRAALAVLRCSKKLALWGKRGADGNPISPRDTFNDKIAADKEVLKVILLLTGGIEGTKQQVYTYLKEFGKYDYLWKDDKMAAYAEFMKTNPLLEDFEAELKKFQEIEDEISDIAPVHNIGALSLETQPLKYSLKAEAQTWKVQYAKNLNESAREKLEGLVAYMNDTTVNLNRKINDLEDVRVIMGVLKGIRDRESEIDLEFGPVEETYQLLDKYEVRVSKEEMDMVNELRYTWRKLRKLAAEVNDTLASLQTGFKRDLVRSVKLFLVDVTQFRNDYNANGPMVEGIPPADAVERLRKFQRMYEERERKWETYSAGEELFGLPVTKYPELEKTKKELNLLDKLYSLYMNVITTLNGYKDIAWSDVVSNIDNMSNEVTEFANQCKKLPKALREWEAYEEMRKTIDDFLETLPLLQALSHKAMRSRHWVQVMNVTGHQLKVDSETFTLKDLLDANLVDAKEDIEEIANSAVKELAIEIKLKQINEDWAEQLFTFANFKNRGPVILKGQETNDIVEKLEDSQMALGSMMSSRYVLPFKEEVTQWAAKLSTVTEIIEQWVVVQSMWIYLEAVFSSGDIAKQLPQEAKRFAQVDKNWIKIMTMAFEKRNVIQCCYGNDLLKNLLPHLTEQLELCQKSLSGYLEAKRNAFPRFYFVSDPVLLEILSQGSDPQAIQQHLQACFDSIVSVAFDKVKKNEITTMMSGEGETVPLSGNVMAQGNIEDWLSRLEQEMRRTMKDIVRNAARDAGAVTLDELVERYPAQVALLGIQFQWTMDCSDAISKAKSDKTIMANTNKKVAAVLSDLTQMTTRELTARMRTNIETLITIQVHQRDIFDELVKKKLKDITDFEWQKQTRFYWKHDQDDCVISITDIDFKYCNEYLGVKERLVITPLTDRCYITLAQACGMFLGGAPAGPAGTGKTETVKDLGRTLGKYVVVTNCSDQMDYRALGKIYKGLAQSGAWGCFDEFNRIELEVLSVAAQQVQSVFTAMRERRETFVFTDGQVVKCSQETGLFITMNPGYAGRQELPENLKALFRGVTMMVPNRQIIIKVKLAAAGFQESGILSKKFHVLYRLCEEQLSKQRHYDFGLRNILSVLRTAGATKRANPDTAENILLMRTLRDMNLSKFVAEDVPLFLSLVNDLFPGVTAEKAKFEQVETALHNQISEAGLVAHDSWVSKVIQLYETSLVRHGIMVVGPAGAGKSACMNMLLSALTETGIPHKEVRMNPKAITAPQMFGALDAISNDWTDGIFSAIWRKVNKNKNVSTWIVCDGPVDAIWIENLNTVLDDNKLLTLANGDRIPMIPNVKLTFEVENLNNASPATVSRAGIIFISATALGWKPVSEAWLANRRPDEAKVIGELLTAHVDNCFEFIRKQLTPVMDVPQVTQIRSLCNMLNGILAAVVESNNNLSADQLGCVFMYCLIWSIGGVLELEDRARFDEYLYTQTPNLLPKNKNGDDTVYEYFVDDTTWEWEHWSSKVPRFEASENEPFSTLLVPTTDSVRIEYLIDLLQKQRLGVILIGSPGSTKTSNVLQYLSKLNGEEMMDKKVSFSSATTPGITQRTVESIVEKRQGRTFGPAGGKKMTVFLDDMSMPYVNEWGDQITSEIVRQLMEMRGFYNLEKPGEWKDILDLQFIGAMTHPGGGRNDIPNRLKGHFSIFNVSLPSKASIDQIYMSILSSKYKEKTCGKALMEVITGLTGATINLWQTVKAKMLPTPAKFHYIFNMRDVSRVFQGFLTSPIDVVTTPEIAIGLWRHECSRVFSDKLISSEDQAWFAECLDTISQQNFKGIAYKDSFFVDFLREPLYDADTGEEIEPAKKVYEPVLDWEKLNEVLYEQMEQYNEAHKVGKLELVLFDDAMKHLIRISRIIRMPRGSAMLVGVGGSGKQSLTRLASFIAGYNIFQITITKSYNETNLFDDLRMLYKTTGVAGQPMTFILTDNEIKKESFLEYINNILSSGEVPGLFAKDEIDGMIGDVRDAARKDRPTMVDSYDNLYKYFIDRVRDNLHMVLCFSPVGEKFRERARQYPGLIGGCTIDWFLRWPVEALLSVATKFLESFPVECDDNTKKQLVQHISTVHETVVGTTEEFFQKFRRQVHVTPKSYLSFINSFKEVYQIKHGEVNSLATKINTGLSKLLTAGEDVAKMKVELQHKEVSLAEAQKVTSDLLVEITASTARAEKVKSEVEKTKNELAKQADQIAKEKAEAEEDLAAAKPALEAAERALKSITPKDIQNLKALKNPPELIKRIFDGVLILRQYPVIKPQAVEVKGKLWILDSYPASVKMMADMTFLDKLLNFDRDAINDETCELLLPYLDMEEFTFETAKKVSGNVAGLLQWVAAMETYHRCAKVVAPKIEALRVAEGRLRVANGKLDTAVAELNEKQRELDEMQAQFDAAMAEKQRLQDDADLTKKRMEAANALINGLSGEKVRWTQQSQEFSDEIKRLVGDVALSCAFMSYCGPFNSDFRDILMTDRFVGDLKAKGIPMTDNLNVVKFLVQESEIGEWNLQGLPTDELSVQNGIMVTRSSKYPVLVDPQGQGLAWIKQREEANQLRITTLNDKNFRTYLEECMTYGRPILIENIDEEIDPVLDPVLEKQIQKSGKSLKIVLPDGKEVDYSEEFKLFMTTRLPNPAFPPELFAKTTVIDFTVTMGGLEQQLLGRVVLKEKAELEEQRQQVLEEVNSCAKKIKELEDDLLHRLSSSSGNLLDDTELIDVLAVTKQTALEVNEKLAVASETERKINTAREEYRPVATRGSVIYFLVSEMSNVNVMYQTSLAQFLQLFDLGIDRAETAMVVSRRISNIIEYLTFSTYLYITRGLLELHKVMYALLLALKIQMKSGEISPQEYNVLLKGGAAIDLKTAARKPFDWLPDVAWANIIALGQGIPVFHDIPDNVSRNQDQWKHWYDEEAPETVEIPEYENKASMFKKLLLVRSIREDRAMLAAQTYIKETLGKKYTDPHPLDLEATMEEGDCRTPLVFILTPGSDPTGLIEGLAKKRKKDLKAVSMGQGQEIIARRYISSAITQGSWVLLQNCHLGLKFLPEVESTLLKTEEIDEDFRIFITSEPHGRFPIGLLQMALKVTNEAPQGLRAGLTRSFQWVNQDMLEAVSKPEWKKLLYTTCFLHSIVQERRKFGPLGWSIPYEFNQTDLSASVQFLQNHLTQAELKKGAISWTTVKYMVCDVQYGGRITDDWDRRLFNAYGDAWLNPKMNDPNFSFFPGYKIPNAQEIPKFRSFVAELPDVDSPEVFGLHSNADLTYRAQEVHQVLNTILDIQPKGSSSSGGLTREEIVNKQADDMLAKLPPNFNKDHVAEQLKKQGASKPLNIHLRQEIDRLQNVISKTRTTLQDLQLAIAGTIIMSSDLAATLDALFDARVPAIWAKISWDSPNVGLWFSGLVARAEQLTKWLNSGRPHCFWMTGFFNPQGFLTAMRQEVTRRHNGWAMDDVVVYTEVTKYEREDVKSGPEEGCYIYGLYLDGCQWDKKANKLVDSAPKVLFSPLPVLLVSAVQASEKRLDVYSYPCPVYKTPKRTDLTFIFTADIRSEDPPQKWILRGVALLCSKE